MFLTTLSTVFCLTATFSYLSVSVSCCSEPTSTILQGLKANEPKGKGAKNLPCVEVTNLNYTCSTYQVSLRCARHC